MPDVFLSYSREDQAIARRFAEGFEREGLSVWWDATLNPGEAFDEVTEKALEEAKAVVVLWSKKSVASRWVRAEATQAHEKRTLVPVMIEPCKRPIMFELTQTADLSQWKGDPGDSKWQLFVAGVRRFVQKGEAAVASPPAVGPARSIGSRSVSIPLLALLLAMIAGAAVWSMSRKNADVAAGSTNPAAANPAARVPAQISLAVLPFDNMSSDPEQEYFSDGLSEELLNQLAQVRELRVMARTSSFSFKGRNEDLREVGAKLGVGHIVAGSVRKSGSQLRIGAQLIDTRDGSQLWSQTYERELKEIFAIQNEIAKAVSQALSVALDVGVMSRANGGTTNLEAYDMYLRARTLSEKGGGPNILQSVDLFRGALSLDPAFQRAWLGLYSSLAASALSYPATATEARTEMSQISERISALAPDAWWSLVLRAAEHRRQREWSEAEAAARTAVALAPEAEIEAAATYAWLLLGLGRASDAAAIYKRATQIDPYSPSLSGNLQMSLDAARRPEEAQAEYLRIKDLLGEARSESDAFALLRALRREDANANAARSAIEYSSPRGVSPGLMRVLVGCPDDRQSAVPAIRQALQDPVNANGVAASIISFYADRCGDRDLALAALRLYSTKAVSLNVLWWPWETSLRSDPGFKEILRELGLVDYFRASGNWGDFCRPTGPEDFECH